MQINEQQYKAEYKPYGKLAPMFLIKEVGLNDLNQPVQNEFYTCLLIKNGQGVNNSDLTRYNFSAVQMYFYTPYQLFEFNSDTAVDGVVVQFHSDFFCLEKHGKELQCNGVLFNNAYGEPFFDLNEEDLGDIERAILALENELKLGGVALEEALLAHLKLFLVAAVRIKLKNIKVSSNTELISPIVSAFEKLVEMHFKEIHSPSKYAEMLGMSLKSLNNICSKNYKKTTLQLIQDRLIIETKRELYLTNKSVKEIAYSLGFSDIQYFNRMFKKKTSLSPGAYRKQLGIFR